MVMEHSTVVGVFTDDAHAEQAVEELRRVGFGADEISVWKSEGGTGGFLDNLKGLFTGKKTASVADFTDMGVAEQDAQYYQSELAAGRTILLVRTGASDLQQSALRVIRQYGGYDAAARQP
jgi:hypothetical protein